MITISVNNSYSRIQGLTSKQEKELRSALSYTVGSFFSGFGPKRKTLLDKKGYFPTGLLDRLTFALDLVTIKFINSRIKPISKPQAFIMYGLPYPWQLDAVKVAESACRGIITAPTGTGKSKAMALLIRRLNVKTLVIVPSLEIKKQLKELFDSTGVPNVTIENIDSTALKTLTDFDCLIIDEGHHVAAKTYQRLNKTAWNKIFYRYFFTATPFRNDTEEQMLFEAIAGQIIYKLSYKDAISHKYIVPVESYYIEIPKQATDAYTYAEVYKELVVNNTIRNFRIVDLLTKLHASGKSTLCLVKEVAHGKILADLTGLPFISGEDDDSRKFIRRFSDGGIKAVIATSAMMGEGLDTRACEYVIVAGLGKAQSHFQQQIGRAVRTYPGKDSAKVILFQDKSHRYLTRHFNAQRAILKSEYGVICQKLEE